MGLLVPQVPPVLSGLLAQPVLRARLDPRVIPELLALRAIPGLPAQHLLFLGLPDLPVLRALTALRVRRVPRVRQELPVLLALLRLFPAPPGRRGLLAPQVPRALPDLRVTLV